MSNHNYDNYPVDTNFNKISTHIFDFASSTNVNLRTHVWNDMFSTTSVCSKNVSARYMIVENSREKMVKNRLMSQSSFPRENSKLHFVASASQRVSPVKSPAAPQFQTALYISPFLGKIRYEISTPALF